MTQPPVSPFAEAIVGVCALTADLAALTRDTDALGARCAALSAGLDVRPVTRPAVAA